MGFDEFVAVRGPALFRLAFLLCGDTHLAEDLVQSALAKAYRHWKRFGDGDSPESYVRTIIVREHASWWRRASSREVVTESPSDLTGAGQVDDLAISVVEADATWAMLATLPRKQRAVLVLRYYLDQSDVQIAGLLGCSPGTVRSSASRALATLRHSAVVTSKEP